MIIEQSEGNPEPFTRSWFPKPETGFPTPESRNLPPLTMERHKGDMI